MREQEAEQFMDEQDYYSCRHNRTRRALDQIMCGCMMSHRDSLRLHLCLSADT